MEITHAATPFPVATERPWWKTLLVATLLMCVPLLGWGMAATYVVYRGSPRNFRWIEAFFVSLLLTGMFFVIAYLVWHRLGLQAAGLSLIGF